MPLLSFALLCILIIGGFPPCLAQQTGPATLETLLNSDEAPRPSVATGADATDATSTRSAGTVTRPRDGVQHPDLDKA
jgi:hypothetical protein